MLAVNMDFTPHITCAGFVSYKCPWMHFKRNADEYILYIIKSGELHLQENGIRYVLRKGDAVLLEPHLDHEGFEKRVCDYYYIHFKHPDIANWAIEDVERFAKGVLLEDSETEDSGSRCCLPKYFSIEDKISMHRIFNGLNEILQLYRRKRYNRSLTALRLCELFILLSRGNLQAELKRSRMWNTKGAVRASELLDYIHLHYQEKITGQQIESLFECSFDYMNRIFRQLTGYSITHYINKVRINHAQELIQATNLGMGEIAFLVGFQDIYYFSRVFKNYAGVSPVAYYKGLREREAP